MEGRITLSIDNRALHDPEDPSMKKFLQDSGLIFSHIKNKFDSYGGRYEIPDESQVKEIEELLDFYLSLYDLDVTSKILIDSEEDILDVTLRIFLDSKYDSCISLARH